MVKINLIGPRAKALQRVLAYARRYELAVWSFGFDRDVNTKPVPADGVVTAYREWQKAVKAV